MFPGFESRGGGGGGGCGLAHVHHCQHDYSPKHPNVALLFCRMSATKVVSCSLLVVSAP